MLEIFGGKALEYDYLNCDVNTERVNHLSDKNVRLFV